MIQLKRLGHVLLRVADIERSKAFYSNILGFEVVEQDPAHGGVFMSLGEFGHTIDLTQAQHAASDVSLDKSRPGLHHIAFQVDSYEALKDAYFTLQEHGVEITRAMDHVSQQSIYFNDPDGNGLEIYYELPNAIELFREGREDRDEPITFTR